MASPFTLWGALGNFFGGSNLHWDRSIAATSFGIGNPLWVDTSSPSSTFVQGASQTYTIWAAGHDMTGGQNGGTAIATTTMVFPFVTGSNTNSSAAGGLVFGQTAKNIQSDGVVWWEAGAAGTYNVKFQALTQDVGKVSTGLPSISLSGSAVTLISGISSPTGWSYSNSATAFVFGYETGTSVSHDIWLQGFNAAGTATSTPIKVGTATAAEWNVRVDPNGIFYYTAEDNSAALAKVQVKTFNPTTGALGSAVTFTTDLADLTSINSRFSSANDGKFFATFEGSAAGSRFLEANVYNSSFVAQGTGAKITLNSSGAIHIETAQLSNNTYVVAYADATTLGGSTFRVFMRLFDANGNQVGDVHQVGTISSFDRVRSIGNGRVEISYRTGTATNNTVISQVFDTNTIGQSVAGTAGNDILPGTAFGDTVNGGAGNDVLGGGPGTNVLNGGGGFDRATYLLSSAAATIVRNANGTVTISGAGFSDTLSGVEVASFTDKSVALSEVARGDFNGDGTSDLVLQSGGVVVDWILQNGAYQAGNVLTTGASGYTVVAKGDLDNDGDADLVLQNGGVVVDWIMQNGAYQSGQVITTGAAGYTVVASGDLDGDGDTDLVLQNGGVVVEWLMENGAYQGGGVLTTGAAGYTVVGSGDVNGDGDADLVLQNGGTVVDWIMKDGAYQTGNVITTGATGFTVKGVGDLDGDGDADLVLQSGGIVLDWIMQNGVYQTGNVITTGATGFNVVGVGDFNGDGTADIALQSGGTVVNWTMKSGLFQSGTVLTTGATGFTVV